VWIRRHNPVTHANAGGGRGAMAVRRRDEPHLPLGWCGRRLRTRRSMRTTALREKYYAEKRDGLPVTKPPLSRRNLAGTLSTDRVSCHRRCQSSPEALAAASNRVIERQPILTLSERVQVTHI
jgi:hypothetical protein